MKESTKPKEKMERGSVKGHVYKQYIAAASTVGVIAFITMNMAAQAFQIVGNLVLRSWGEKNLEIGTTGTFDLFFATPSSVADTYASQPTSASTSSSTACRACSLRRLTWPRACSFGPTVRFVAAGSFTTTPSPVRRPFALAGQRLVGI